MADTNKPNDNYDASKIQKLEGLEGVRKRPDMYIGDTNERGLHHCVFEIVDNSIDEALAGYCNLIKVSIHNDGSCSVEDNGRGIPVDIHPKYKIPALELVMTNLHAGGKFGKGAYQVSGGLHGVGAKCVNAVSEYFEVEVRKGGKIYKMEFSRGKTTMPMTIIGNTKTTGTKITFIPDPAARHNPSVRHLNHARKSLAFSACQGVDCYDQGGMNPLANAFDDIERSYARHPADIAFDRGKTPFCRVFDAAADKMLGHRKPLDRLRSECVSRQPFVADADGKNQSFPKPRAATKRYQIARQNPFDFAGVFAVKNGVTVQFERKFTRRSLPFGRRQRTEKMLANALVLLCIFERTALQKNRIELSCHTLKIIGIKNKIITEKSLQSYF